MIDSRFRPGHPRVEAFVIELPGSINYLLPRNDEVNHSPDGFNVGYGGSGPAQLAYAICRDLLGNKTQAEKAYRIILRLRTSRIERGSLVVLSSAVLLADLRLSGMPIPARPEETGPEAQPP